MSRLLLVLATLALCASVQAHSVTLSVLRVREVSSGSFRLSWERADGLHDPDAADLVLRPRFPAHCALQGPILRCPEPGLAGNVVFAGLAADPAATLVMEVERLDGTVQSYTASGVDPMVTVAPKTSPDVSWTRVAAAFTALGIEHIWLGWDHLAFVLGLWWLVRGRGMLVKTITAFTIAHSLTLSAATTGVLSLPAAPTEAVIALSVMLLAVELLRRSRTGTEGMTSQRPWRVAFAFGLLHGLGFAGALAEIYTPPQQRLLALGFFNLGVEIGQLGFVAAASLSVAALRRSFGEQLARAAPMAQYAMGTLAAYWAVARIAGFWQP